MNLVLITALGVGGATLAGTIIGFCFKKVPEKWNDAIMSFAAGVMLCAAVLGLIVPAVELTGKAGLWQAVAGNFTGALFLNLMVSSPPICITFPVWVGKNSTTTEISIRCFCLFLPLPFTICRGLSGRGRLWRRGY